MKKKIVNKRLVDVPEPTPPAKEDEILAILIKELIGEIQGLRKWIDEAPDFWRQGKYE